MTFRPAIFDHHILPFDVADFFGDVVMREPLRYALAVNPPVRVPVALNGFALWNVILLMFMIVEYGYPIGQFFVLKSSVPAFEMTRHEP